jgi:hypothetical protein
MNFKFLILSLCFLVNSSIDKNQTLVTVTDKVTELPISYVNISFGDNDGIYTNENGQFNLNLITADKMSLSALGYKTKTVISDSITNQVIFLDPENTLLEEVILDNFKRKFKIQKTKPINDKDYLNSYRNPIGNEIACFIENRFNDNDIQLKSITIPSYNKTMDLTGPRKQILKRHPFSTLYKINFYENDNGLPGNHIKTENITVLFNEKTDKLKIDLETHQIYIPQTGCFISLLNLGPADENGVLIPTSPFYERKTKKGTFQFPKHIRPYFPVNYDKNEHNTYQRSTFGTNNVWEVFYLNNSKLDMVNNISLGHELKIFDE